MVPQDPAGVPMGYEGFREIPNGYSYFRTDSGELRCTPKTSEGFQYIPLGFVWIPMDSNEIPMGSAAHRQDSTGL